MNIYIKNLNLSFPDRRDFENNNVADCHKSTNSSIPIFSKHAAPDGTYVYTDSGLWLPQYWGLCEDKAKSIAFIKGDMKRMIALKGSDEGIELLEDGVKVALEEYDSIEKALKDNAGFENTEVLLKAGSKAAAFCKSFGKEWYLPTLNEMTTLQEDRNRIDAALTICGGEPLPTLYHWTSTRYNSRCNFFLDWTYGYRYYYVQDDSMRVRPVSAF